MFCSLADYTCIACVEPLLSWGEKWPKSGPEWRSPDLKFSVCFVLLGLAARMGTEAKP